jgi:hypothetical protein
MELQIRNGQAPIPYWQAGAILDTFVTYQMEPVLPITTYVNVVGLRRDNSAFGFRICHKFFTRPFFRSLWAVNPYVFNFVLLFLFLLGRPVLGTSISVRIRNEREAAVSADSRRVKMDPDGFAIEHKDDRCKVCAIKNGVFVTAGPDQSEFPTCEIAQMIAERTNEGSARLDQFITATVPKFQNFILSFRGTDLFRYWISHPLEAAFIQIESATISWGLTILTASQTGTEVVAKPEIRQACPPTCNRPFFFMGSGDAWSYERLNRRVLIPLSAVDFVSTVIRNVIATDSNVGGPITVVSLDLAGGVQWLDRGVCPAPIIPAEPKKKRRKK